MEPLLIASSAAKAAQSAWKVGVALYEFTRDVKAIDQTIHGLIAEINALSTACSMVDRRLQDIVKDHDDRSRVELVDRTRLWSCIEGQVTDCQRTISQLEAAIASVRKDGKHVLAQMWRQIKLNMSSKDIAEARNRIRSHTAGLQMVLQTAAIEIYYLTPQRADQQLRTLLGRVEECMEQLKMLRAERSEHDEHQIGVLDALDFSKETVTNGESLYASSIANGSLIGGLPMKDREAKVQAWMQDLNAIDRVRSNPDPEDTDLASTASSENPSGGLTELSRGSTAITDVQDYDLTPEDEDEYESDDEFLVEAAKEALAAGRSSFEAKRYADASTYLQEGLKMVRQLPVRQQTICDTWQVRYLLGICTYHTQDAAEAETHLLDIVDTASRMNLRDNEQRLQVCNAGHLLGKLYVNLGQLEQARLYCGNAMKGRHRLLGLSHHDSYESLGLMARILQLQGNTARSKIYLRMIPESERGDDAPPPSVVRHQQAHDEAHSGRQNAVSLPELQVTSHNPLTEPATSEWKTSPRYMPEPMDGRISDVSATLSSLNLDGLHDHTRRKRPERTTPSPRSMDRPQAKTRVLSAPQVATHELPPSSRRSRANRGQTLYDKMGWTKEETSRAELKRTPEDERQQIRTDLEISRAELTSRPVNKEKLVAKATNAGEGVEEISIEHRAIVSSSVIVPTRSKATPPARGAVDTRRFDGFDRFRISHISHSPHSLRQYWTTVEGKLEEWEIYGLHAPKDTIIRFDDTQHKLDRVCVRRGSKEDSRFSEELLHAARDARQLSTDIANYGEAQPASLLLLEAQSTAGSVFEKKSVLNRLLGSLPVGDAKSIAIKIAGAGTITVLLLSGESAEQAKACKKLVADIRNGLYDKSSDYSVSTTSIDVPGRQAKQDIDGFSITRPPTRLKRKDDLLLGYVIDGLDVVRRVFKSCTPARDGEMRKAYGLITSCEIVVGNPSSDTRGDRYMAKYDNSSG